MEEKYNSNCTTGDTPIKVDYVVDKDSKFVLSDFLNTFAMKINERLSGDKITQQDIDDFLRDY
jgi:hypothetical protein